MKMALSVYFGLFLTSCFASMPAMAAKQCFGVGADRGVRFELTLSGNEAIIQSSAGNEAPLLGLYRRDPHAQSVLGKFGNSYLVYESKPMNTLLVDQDLLDFGRTGIVKLVRAGDGIASFFCHE